MFQVFQVFGDYGWTGFDDPADRRLRNGSAKPEKPEKHVKPLAFSGYCRTADLKNPKNLINICFFRFVYNQRPEIPEKTLIFNVGPVLKTIQFN